MTPTSEQWRPVVGYEGYYEVSDQGRVRSLDRYATNSVGRRRRFYPGKILKPSINDQHGRRMVWLCVDADRKRFTIYTLVLTAFVGPRPPGMIACHNDDDCVNDQLDNLRWDTPRENNLDMVRNGNHFHANKTHCPRGHELIAPNLIPSALNRIGLRPGRVCLACNRGRGRTKRQKRLGLPYDLQSLSDAAYEELMSTH